MAEEKLADAAFDEGQALALKQAANHLIEKWEELNMHGMHGFDFLYELAVRYQAKHDNLLRDAEANKALYTSYKRQATEAEVEELRVRLEDAMRAARAEPREVEVVAVEEEEEDVADQLATPRSPRS
jgi:ADP-dependent phosphofructokinase/glucokinase